MASVHNSVDTIEILHDEMSDFEMLHDAMSHFEMLYDAMSHFLNYIFTRYHHYMLGTLNKLRS